MPTSLDGPSFRDINALELLQAAVWSQYPPHAYIVWFLRKPVDQLLVPHDDDNARVRVGGPQCPVVVTSTPPEPDSASIDSQCGDEHEFGSRYRLGRHGVAVGLQQAITRLAQLIGAGVLGPTQWCWFGYPTGLRWLGGWLFRWLGHRKQHTRTGRAKRIQHCERARFTAHRDVGAYPFPRIDPLCRCGQCGCLGDAFRFGQCCSLRQNSAAPRMFIALTRHVHSVHQCC